MSQCRPVPPHPSSQTLLREPRRLSRGLTTSARLGAVSTPRKTPDLRNHDRGPASKEDTQTDFSALNVLGGTANPSTSIDICMFDGFMLDSGLKVGEGDGVLLTASEAFVWRPWMEGGLGAGQNTTEKGAGIVSGSSLRVGASESARTGGVINAMGQFEISKHAWGLFALLWPKPDLLIVGTGPSIRPLAPATRSYLQELGVRIEVLDTRNAASQFNLLATERGVQEVAAAMVPIGFGLPKKTSAIHQAFGRKGRRKGADALHV